jgi:DNA-binding MarR family transcriptional regulator
MDDRFLKKFREILRLLDRELFYQNVSSCCGGITLAQCHTLLEIENNEDISITELAENLLLDKSTVSRSVENLVQSGYVDRIIPTENRRITTLNLTRSGKNACKNIRWNKEKYLETAVSKFSDKDKKELLRLLDKITLNMIHLRRNADNCENDAC